MTLARYRIQQDKGKYCLKACEDGDLIDYAEYTAAVERLTRQLEGAQRDIGRLIQARDEEIEAVAEWRQQADQNYRRASRLRAALSRVWKYLPVEEQEALAGEVK